jgi:hypothetical protein
MKNSRHSQFGFSLLGMAALLAYVLACRPAFSPDGSKVLIPVANETNQDMALVLYDRGSGKSEVVFTAHKAEEQFPPVSATWLPDGKRAAVICGHPGNPGSVHVLTLPLGASQPVRMFDLDLGEESESTVFLPPVTSGSYLFLAQKSIHRINLQTGEMKTSEVFAAEEDGTIMLTGQGNQIFYVGGQPAREDQTADFTFGRLDPESLKLAPIAKLPAAEFGDLSPYFAVTPDGAQAVFPSSRQRQLAILKNKALAKKIQLQGRFEKGLLGNVVWSAGAKTIFAAFSLKTGDSDLLNVGILEVAVETGDMKFYPLFHAAEDGLEFLHQVAISPDGRYVAASSALLEKIKPEIRALYLLDTANPDRKYTRIPLILPRY